MATSRGTWKQFEAVVASAWTEAIGFLCKRNPLSGANNISDTGERRPGDVIVNSEFNPDVLIECKYRSTHAHHTLYREAEADAKKHGLSHTLLYTRVKREQGYLVVLDADVFHQLLAIKEVQQVFSKVGETSPIRSRRNGKRSSPAADDH